MKTYDRIMIGLMFFSIISRVNDEPGVVPPALLFGVGSWFLWSIIKDFRSAGDDE